MLSANVRRVRLAWQPGECICEAALQMAATGRFGLLWRQKRAAKQPRERERESHPFRTRCARPASVGKTACCLLAATQQASKRARLCLCLQSWPSFSFVRSAAAKLANAHCVCISSFPHAHYVASLSLSVAAWRSLLVSSTKPPMVERMQISANFLSILSWLHSNSNIPHLSSSRWPLRALVSCCRRRRRRSVGVNTSQDTRLDRFASIPLAGQLGRTRKLPDQASKQASCCCCCRRR